MYFKELYKMLQSVRLLRNRRTSHIGCQKHALINEHFVYDCIFIHLRLIRSHEFPLFCLAFLTTIIWDRNLQLGWKFHT